MTLCDLMRGQQPRKEAHKPQQLLSQPQEEVLHDWIEFNALIAKPFNMEALQYLVAKLSERPPGKHWIYWYKKCWPQLSYSKPGGLDPKWEHNFNSSNVEGFFKLLKVIYDAYPEFPPQNIWNMDEKRLQLGGGHE